MAGQLEHRPATVAEALRRSAGVVTHAAEMLRVTPQTVRRYIRLHDECKEAKYEAREANLDLAETKLLQNIKKGKEASIFFYLKTMGKDRGFIERSELTGKNGVPLATQGPRTIDTSKLTLAEKMALIAAAIEEDGETIEGEALPVEDADADFGG